MPQKKSVGEYEQICHIPANFLNWGNYAIDFMAFEFISGVKELLRETDLILFSLAGRAIEVGGWMGKEPGDVTPHFEFEEQKIG